MTSEEARQIAAGNASSFLHVSKPEIDLPPETDPYDPRVYEKGKENFSQLIREGSLKLESQPRFYLYRQIMGKHSQTGLVAAASCEDFIRNAIKKHELTRPDKEDDRVRHIEALNAQTGPVFLVYPSDAALARCLAQESKEAPEIDFTAPDGVRHSSWTIVDPGDISLIQEKFAQMPALYIADGHHRSAAAVRVWRKREGAGSSGSFLSVLFPHDQVQILPYNRALSDLNGLSPAEALEKLGGIFEIRKAGAASLARKNEMGFYLEKQWYTLSFRPRFAVTTDPVERLDVTLLQKHALEPLFGIDDPRTSKRIRFVGGIRGPGELERLVDRGECACAFSMFPTSIEDLMTIADAGGIMPPKSTWFEPKLRDGMFCHLIEPSPPGKAGEFK